MLKGKTIISNIQEDIDNYGIINKSIISEAPSILKSKVIKNECSSFDYIHNNILKPKVIKQCSELDFQKTIIKNESSAEDIIEVIEPTKNIRVSVDFLKQKFPGFNNLYYIEIFDLLESTDFNLNEYNINLNIQKLIHLGNNIQSQISRLNQNLSVNRTSYNSIKTEISDKIGFFCSDSELKTLFEEFNSKINILYSSIYKEYNNLKNIDFNKYNLINLYYNFFFYIDSELSEKFNFESDIIKSRILSLNNSNQVLEQFKLLVQIEIKTKETELENLKNYSDILKPSLYVLEHQNFKEFKEQFKKLIKS